MRYSFPSCNRAWKFAFYLSPITATYEEFKFKNSRQLKFLCPCESSRTRCFTMLILMNNKQKQFPYMSLEKPVP